MNLKLIVSTLLLASAATGTAVADGQDTYSKTCAMCHATGVAGAPILGNKAAWAPRIAQGVNVLVASATNGKGAMPPKGTCNACSATELQNAVEYMIAKSK